MAKYGRDNLTTTILNDGYINTVIDIAKNLTYNSRTMNLSMIRLADVHSLHVYNKKHCVIYICDAHKQTNEISLCCRCLYVRVRRLSDIEFVWGLGLPEFKFMTSSFIVYIRVDIAFSLPHFNFICTVKKIQEEGKYAIDSPGSPNQFDIPPEDYALRK